jgi:hypothetical protein
MPKVFGSGYQPSAIGFQQKELKTISWLIADR